MSNIWRLFLGDVRRLTRNIVAGIIVLGLIFTPSIFSWYNVLACWNVFDNTGGLTVAVANTDAGYESDLIPLRVNIGEQVVSALRANDQLNWKFTTEEDAIDGTASGKYYAAVVIPESFSEDMMTFYSDDVEHGKLIYYTNEKKSAIAPKVTGQGADQVSYQVNQVFTKTITELALGISESLYNYADSTDADGRIGVLANHITTMGTQMSQTADVLRTYSDLIGSAQSLIDGSADLLGQAQSEVDTVESSADGSYESVSSLSSALSASSSALSDALAASSAAYSSLSDSIDATLDSSDALSADTADTLRDRADDVDTQIARYQTLLDQLKALDAQVPESSKPAIESMIDLLETSIGLQEDLRDKLDEAADAIESGTGDLDEDIASIKALTDQAQASVSQVSTDFDQDIRPSLDTLDSDIATTVSSLQSSAEELDSVSSDLQGSSDSISGQLETARVQLDEAADDLDTSAGKMTALGQSITQALALGDSEALSAILSSDPETLATALSAPVVLERHAVFPAENFGSQMAPLYTTLALWIGSLLLVVAIKVAVSDEAKEELRDPKPRQLFLGRYGVFALLSFLQSTVMALGNLFFLGVQATNPFLYVLCMWIAGEVFTFFIYSLVVSFANLGKAIAVFLLIIQVTGGGGSFPLQLLPHFISAISPYLPATHAINAMRAAMMGIYMNDFWIEICQLLAFLVPAALLGLALRKPLVRLIDWYVRKVEDSKLVS